MSPDRLNTFQLWMYNMFGSIYTDVCVQLINVAAPDKVQVLHELPDSFPVNDVMLRGLLDTDTSLHEEIEVSLFTADNMCVHIVGSFSNSPLRCG